MDYGIVTGLTESLSTTSGSRGTDENEWVVLMAVEPRQSIGIKAILMSYILDSLV